MIEVVEGIGGYVVQIGDLRAGTYATKEQAEFWGQVIVDGVSAEVEKLELTKKLEDSKVEINNTPLPDRVLAFELQLLANAMHLTRGNQTQAAKALGIGRTTLNEKLKRHGIREEE